MAALSRQFSPVDPYGLRGTGNKHVNEVLSQKVLKDPPPMVVQRRLRNVYRTAPDDVREAGLNWYANVHDAAMKSARDSGKSTRQAAGVVAAVSPNMDWERNNIDAFHEIDTISHEGWDVIKRSAQGKSRNDEARDVLKGLSISSAADPALLKAHAIWHGGADPDHVLRRSGAPKTNSFYHNIAEPHKAGYVTVDGRHADIVTDAMRPWRMDRGIKSAQMKGGVATRYERYSEETARAAHFLGILPHQLQAVVWEHGKRIERGYNPDRKMSPVRVGQSYMKGISRQFQGVS